MELEKFKILLEQMFELKAGLAELDKHKKEMTAKLNGYKAEAMVALAENDMKSFSAGGLSLTKVDKKSVKIIDKNLLMNWLDDKGELRDALTVSAATATKIYNEEFEQAQENKDMDFLLNGIPGLTQPETHSLISMKGNIK